MSLKITFSTPPSFEGSGFYRAAMKQISPITALRVMVLARKHCESGKAIQPSSALLSLADADIILRKNPGLAAARARKSLAYSVGVCHKDYKRAESIINAAAEKVFNAQG